MPPPETTKLEIPEWTGSGLSNGDHLAYAKDLYNIYSKGDYTPLSLEEIGQLLTPALESLNAAVNRQRSFDETSDVTTADAVRDRLFYALWSAWDYLSQLDPHHPFYVAANTLRSEMMKCKGAARFKLEQETEAIYGLQHALENLGNHTALETLGLDKIAAALWEANEAVKTAMDARNMERGERADGRADGSVPELRKTVSDLLCRCAKRVTALYMITPSEEAAKAIKAAVGVVEQYKRIAAQPAKHKKEEPEPAPEA